MRIGVVGAGAGGTALAQVAAAAGEPVLIWALEPEVVASINDRHENSLYLKGLPLSRSIEAVAKAWLEIYRDADRWFDLYELAEKLVDIDDALAAWRHKHVLTVERIIGNRPGTGGSAGAPYLRATLEKRVFPELWALRTDL